MRTRKATPAEQSRYMELSRPIRTQIRSIIQATNGKPMDDDARQHRALIRQMDQIREEHKFHISPSGLRVRLD